MAKYVINKGSATSARTVSAEDYDQEGEYFVFYDAEREKVLTIVASGVRSIELEAE